MAVVVTVTTTACVMDGWVTTTVDMVEAAGVACDWSGTSVIAAVGGLLVFAPAAGASWTAGDVVAAGGGEPWPSTLTTA